MKLSSFFEDMILLAEVTTVIPRIASLFKKKRATLINVEVITMTNVVEEGTCNSSFLIIRKDPYHRNKTKGHLSGGESIVSESMNLRNCDLAMHP